MASDGEESVLLPACRAQSITQAWRLMKPASHMTQNAQSTHTVAHLPPRASRVEGRRGEWVEGLDSGGFKVNHLPNSTTKHTGLVLVSSMLKQTCVTGQGIRKCTQDDARPLI